MPLITSRQNAKIRQARALAHRKARDESGLFVVEGIRHVGEAAESGAPFEYVLYAPGLLTSEFALSLVERLDSHGVPCHPVSPDAFTSAASKDNPVGLLAVLRQDLTPLSALTPESFSWGVALLAPQDPGNVGTILRTVDAVGADSLLLLDHGVDPHHPTAVRASMGALFWHPLARASFEQFTSWARAGGFHLYGSSAHGAVDYTQIERYRRPAVLLLGSERRGLSPEQSAQCEAVVKLPMHGRATSLNLSVAAGVLLYDMASKLQP